MVDLKREVNELLITKKESPKYTAPDGVDKLINQ